MEIDQSLIEGITKIANSENLIKQVEANVAFPQGVHEWMTRRVLYALCLFIIKLEAQRDGTKESPESR